MPVQRILPTKHDVRLIRKIQEPTANPTLLADIVRSETLVHVAAVIPGAVDDEHGCGPVASVPAWIMLLPLSRVLPQLAEKIVADGGGDVACVHGA